MLDLSKNQKGRLGEEVFVSDLFGSALTASYTGAIFVKTADAAAELYFRKGEPIHARGTLFKNDRLGELLLAQGTVNETALQTALARQEREPAAGLLLGVLLSDARAVELPVVQMALKAQLAGRIQQLFALTVGSYTTELGTFGPIDKVAMPQEALPLLASCLYKASSEKELTKLSDGLLGQAVKSKADAERTRSLGVPSEALARALHLLDRPRKPEQVERHLKDRRAVRATLKALHVLGSLELLPGSEGRPIIDKKTAEEAITRSQAQSGTRDASGIKGAAPSAVAIPKARTASRKDSPLAKEIRELTDTIAAQNFFELFDYELGKPIDPAELRKRFSALAKKFHPDTLSRTESEEIQGLARDLLAKYNDAYATLSDEKRRAEYQTALLRGEVPADESQKAKAAVAKTKFDMALVMMKKKDYKKARELLKMATTMDPKQGLYKCHYGWAFWIDPELDRETAVAKARELIQTGITENPKVAVSQYYWGVILKHDGKLKEAKKAFTVASKMDPRLTDAERELRLMEMRSNKQQGEREEKKGLLGKLFKLGKG